MLVAHPSSHPAATLPESSVSQRSCLSPSTYGLKNVSAVLWPCRSSARRASHQSAAGIGGVCAVGG